jgi:hypothetical protein
LWGSFFEVFRSSGNTSMSLVLTGAMGGKTHIPMVVGDGNDLLALLWLIARLANSVAPIFATVLVPSPWRMQRLRGFSSARRAILTMNACWRELSSNHLAKAV